MTAFRNAARIVSAWTALLFVILIANPARAQEDVIQFLKNSLSDVQKQLKDALVRIEQLEKEKSTTAAKVDQFAADKAADEARVAEVEKSVLTLRSSPSALNPAIGLVLDANVQHRSKSGGNFDFRSAELGVAASVDPYARLSLWVRAV